MGYYWDIFTLENQIADEYDISDLSEKQILNAVRMGVRGGRMPESALSLSTEDILKRLSLLKDGKPIQAAVALFCDKLHYTPQLKLRMARFKGINKNEFVDSQNASGCFFDLPDAGISKSSTLLSPITLPCKFKCLKQNDIPASGKSKKQPLAF